MLYLIKCNDSTCIEIIQKSFKFCFIGMLRILGKLTARKWIKDLDWIKDEEQWDECIHTFFIG